MDAIDHGLALEPQAAPSLAMMCQCWALALALARSWALPLAWALLLALGTPVALPAGAGLALPLALRCLQPHGPKAAPSRMLVMELLVLVLPSQAAP